MATRFQSYEEFWPYYVAQHRHPVNRALHFVGTSLVLVCVALALVRSPFWIAAAFLAGYAFAWFGHFVFERNRPATFTYPFWSFRADFRMYRLLWLGRMAPETRRAAERFPVGA